jgi:hypothetical protein
MLRQLESLGLLTRVISHEQRPEIERLQNQLNELLNTVDGFYSVLGPRNWVFHESLSLGLAKKIAAKPADQAESHLIAHYEDPDELRSMINRVQNHPFMRPRLRQIEKAKRDFEQERYYSTVLLLLAVMDGFVNDMDPGRRRGLNARDADEMVAWDSVVGHHMGLTNAHQTFTKGFYKTSDDEVFELYRNGIMHGTLTNFDNEIVASKAWNRLFAVADWAKSREREEQPVEPEPSLGDLMRQMQETETVKKATAAWKPSKVHRDDPGLTKHPIFKAAQEFLEAWKTKNYGAMAGLLATNALSYDDSRGKAAGNVRGEYELMPLDDFEIVELDFQAAVICEVEAKLTCQGETKQAWLRWIREDGKGGPALLDADGSWRVMSWGPGAFFNHRVADEVDD